MLSRLVLPREPSPPPPLLSWPPLASSCVSGGHSCAWRTHVPVHAASWQAPPAPVSPSIVSMPPFPGGKLLVLIELQRGASLCTTVLTCSVGLCTSRFLKIAGGSCGTTIFPVSGWRFTCCGACGVCGVWCRMRVRELLCTVQQYTEHQTPQRLAKPACCSRLTACKLVKVEAWNVAQWMSVNALYGGMPSCCAVCVLCDHEVMHESSLALAQTNNGKVWRAVVPALPFWPPAFPRVPSFHQTATHTTILL